MKERHWNSGYSSRRFREQKSDIRFDKVWRWQPGADHPKGEHWIVIKNHPDDVWERLRTARPLNYGFGADGLVVNFRSALRASIFVMSHDLEYILPSS